MESTKKDISILLPKHLIKYIDESKLRQKYIFFELIFLFVNKYIKYTSIGKDNSIIYSKIILNAFM